MDNAENILKDAGWVHMKASSLICAKYIWIQIKGQALTMKPRLLFLIITLNSQDVSKKVKLYLWADITSYVNWMKEKHKTFAEVDIYDRSS